MNTRWFLIGLALIFVAAVWYAGADHLGYQAKKDLFYGKATLDDIHNLELSKDIALAAGVCGVLISLAGITMGSERATLRKRRKNQPEKEEEWIIYQKDGEES